MVGMTTHSYLGGVVSAASEVSPHLVDRLLEQGAVVNAVRHSRLTRKQPGFNLDEIEVEGPLPGDPHQMRLDSCGVAYMPNDRAKKTEKKRRQLRLELQAAILEQQVNGAPIPVELCQRATQLLRKGRLNIRYVEGQQTLAAEVAAISPDVPLPVVLTPKAEAELSAPVVPVPAWVNRLNRQFERRQRKSA